MSKIKILSLGSDPEFLILNTSTDKVVSSLGLIEGEKDAPIDLTELGDGFTIQKDNVLAEICVPPSETGEELYADIKKAMEYIDSNILPEGFKLVAMTGAQFDQEELDNDYARAFGCSPSYNAWSYSKNITEANPFEPLYRGAGFHIHIGYENPDIETSADLIRAMDIFLGVPSVIFDSDKIRRQQYGRAGEFRETKYGVEYRVLGGYVMSDKNFFDSAMLGLERAVEFVNSGNINKLSDTDMLDIQTCINTNNVRLANTLVDKYSMESIISKVFAVDG